ncbi:WecB/TagA/CpsF family glycosyltransferase [Caldanaerobius polysaccharolyticus]|uniref:WecB/TagA/CpsF family glycosyltransferase n=1 Tax=Caldanaerobius polysaccharolyticus TaxID=44256 RepID=UPI00047A5E1C|nr:WecB/TagA/CpsF family glycosyltransferase [Caldanaerobius polysaccharolyticus]
MIERQRKVVNILGVPVDNIDIKEAVNLIEKFILELDDIRCRVVYTPNPEMIMKAQEDRELKGILNDGDLNIPDGIGVVIASKLLGKPLKCRVAGYDLMMEIIKLCHQKDYSICFLGGQPGVAEQAKNRVEQMYKGIKVTGAYHGYFSPDYEDVILEEINIKAPDVLFVGMGVPKQEKWIHKYKGELYSGVCMAVGGSLDVLAGKVKRAPRAFQVLGLEWLYRLVTQPWRYKRMLALPRFMVQILKERKKVM